MRVVRTVSLQRLLFGTLAVLMLTGIASEVLVNKASAASPTQITSRSLTLQAGSGGDGGSKPSGVVNQYYQFTLTDPTYASDPIGSISFQFCTTAAPVAGGIGCVAPTGLSTSGVTLGTETGLTGFTTVTTSTEDDANDSNLNKVTIGRASAAAMASSPTAVSYILQGVTNPSTPQTFFARISTWSGTNGTGTEYEAGTVAAATSLQINLSGTMPESLVFCAGATVGTTLGVPDCTTVTTGDVAFNQLFSPTATAYATSQMAASTNAGSGYAITINGPTLTSGSNTISAIAATSGPVLGTSQFGTNLVANDGTPSGPIVGIAVAPATNATNYNATPATGYNTDEQFTYVDGATVATSNSKGTDAQIYTNSYIVNVPGSQPAGTYSTVLTYICTPTY